MAALQPPCRSDGLGPRSQTLEHQPWSRTIICVGSQGKEGILLSMRETLDWEKEGSSMRKTDEKQVLGEQRRTILPTNLPKVSAGSRPPIRSCFCSVLPALLLSNQGRSLCSCLVLCCPGVLLTQSGSAPRPAVGYRSPQHPGLGGCSLF